MKISYRRQFTAHDAVEERWLDLEFNVTEYDSLENIIDTLIDNFNDQMYIEEGVVEDKDANL